MTNGVNDRRRAVAEIAAVVVAALVHVAATLWLDAYPFDIAVIGGAFVGYAALRLRRRDVRATWGLRSHGLRGAARDAAGWFAAGVAVLAAIALARGTFVLDANLLPLLVLYPLWGLVQQVLVLGLVVANAERLGASRAAVLAIAALGFAAVHLPDLRLCGATLLLGLLAAVLFLRHRNLWPLALLHGWLGAFFYRWILDRDPWGELLDALR